MSIQIPKKPKFMKGMIIYSVIALLLTIIILVSLFTSNETVDWNRDGVIDINDDIYSHNAFGDYSFEPSLYASAVMIPFSLFTPLLFYSVYFLTKYSEYKLATNNYPEYVRRKLEKLERQLKQAEAKQALIDAEYQAAVDSQKSTEPWAVRYSTSPCPYCGHYKVRNAKWEDKSLSVAFWGIASSKIGTNYKCEYCNRMWE